MSKMNSCTKKCLISIENISIFIPFLQNQIVLKILAVIGEICQNIVSRFKGRAIWILSEKSLLLQPERSRSVPFSFFYIELAASGCSAGCKGGCIRADTLSGRRLKEATRVEYLRRNYYCQQFYKEGKHLIRPPDHSRFESS